MNFRLAMVLLGVTATAAAAQRVSFPSFTGPGATGVRNQIVGAVCDTADCVAATKTTTAGKPDWKKARKESVAFFVSGNVVKKGKALSLDLQVLTKAGPPKAKKTFALDKNGTLPAKGLQGVMDLLTTSFGGAGARPTPTEAPPAVEPTRPTPVATKPTPSEPAPTRTQRKETPPPTEPDPVEPPPSTTRRSKPKFLMIDVGADIFTRKLEYSQVATSNLRRYDLPPVGQPAIGLQFFPLALMRDDLLAGLGVEFGIAFAPWIQSRLISAGDAYPTSAMRIDAGVRFDLAPIKTFALTISPYVGVRSQSFTVGPLKDGSRITGLPNIAFVGLRAGVGLDVPIIPQRLSLFGRFGIIPVFSSGEIISSAFFPTGSAFGLEADAGVGVHLLPFLQVRASFEFARYGLTFVTQPTDAYVATGAADTYLGGNASLRLSF